MARRIDLANDVLESLNTALTESSMAFNDEMIQPEDKETYNRMVQKAQGYLVEARRILLQQPFGYLNVEVGTQALEQEDESISTWRSTISATHPWERTSVTNSSTTSWPNGIGSRRARRRSEPPSFWQRRTT